MNHILSQDSKMALRVSGNRIAGYSSLNKRRTFDCIMRRHNDDRHRMKMFFLLLILCLSFVQTNAQENGQADTVKIGFDKLLNLSFEDLMNVSVITPTKNLQKSDRAPATVLVISYEQIRLRGYRNLAEVLNDLPGFTVNDKTEPQFYNSASVRGVMGQDHFVVLMDGVRISSPTNEPLPLLENFPIYLAKQIEVVYGPGSALYGADAMGGVINIITSQPGGAKRVAAAVTGGTYGYSNANAVFNIRLKNDLKLSFAGQYTYDVQPDFSKLYKEQYDLTSHETGVFNSIYGPMLPQAPVSAVYESPVKSYNAYAALGKGGFSMKVLHHYAQVPSSTTLSPNNAVYNKDVFYGQGVTVVSADQTISAGKFKSISTFVGSFYEVNPRSNFRNLYGNMEQGYKYSTGSMLKVEEQLHYSFLKSLDVTGGLTYELFQSLPKTMELQSPVDRNGAVRGILLNSVTANNPTGIEAKFFPLVYTNIGGYLQAQYSPLDALSFTAGVRYDKNSRYGATINPRIGAVFAPFENTAIKTLYGTAYWAPSPLVAFEAYGSFYPTDNGSTYESSFWHLPNPGLRPMTSQSMELSISQKLNDNITVTAVGYRTTIDDLIQEVSDNGYTNLYNNKFLGYNVAQIEVPFNKGSQENYGAHLHVNAAFNIGRVDFHSYTSLSYLDGKLDDYGTTLHSVEQPVITPWQFRTGLDGKVGAFHFSARWLEAGKQRMHKFMDASRNGERQTIDGYSLVNISVGYTLRKATFFVNVRNALDQKYTHPINSVEIDLEQNFQNPARIMAGVRVSF